MKPRGAGSGGASFRQGRRGLLRGVLLFLAGLLAGANLLYFVWSRQVDTPADPAASPMPAAPTASPASASRDAAVPAAPAATDAAAPIQPTVPPSAAPPPATSATLGSAPPAAATTSLLIPVQGIRAGQLQDTFNDARAQGRSHEAIDIMAPAGTPVLAVADGTVEKLFTSDAGGLTVYQFEPSGRYAYYYAHLQSYAPGLAERQAVRRGDLIGYVGSTGNANPAAPHLHFAVFVLGPERRWWQGQAINPYPLLHRQ